MNSALLRLSTHYLYLLTKKDVNETLAGRPFHPIPSISSVVFSLLGSNDHNVKEVSFLMFRLNLCSNIWPNTNGCVKYKPLGRAPKGKDKNQGGKCSAIENLLCVAKLTVVFRVLPFAMAHNRVGMSWQQTNRRYKLQILNAALNKLHTNIHM